MGKEFIRDGTDSRVARNQKFTSVAFDKLYGKPSFVGSLKAVTSGVNTLKNISEAGLSSIGEMLSENPVVQGAKSFFEDAAGFFGIGQTEAEKAQSARADAEKRQREERGNKMLE